VVELSAVGAIMTRVVGNLYRTKSVFVIKWNECVTGMRALSSNVS
jgi:hypothetical protein